MTPFEQVFDWIEHTDLSLWVRGESLFAFPFILVIHTIGMGFVAGIGSFIAIRILGFPADVPLAPLQKFYPAFWVGFAMNATSGVLLWMGYPYKAVTNPVFYVKLCFIALGVYLAVRIRNEVLRAPYAVGGAVAVAMPRHAIMLARLSVFSWVGAITAGRLLAYTFTWLRVGIPGGF